MNDIKLTSQDAENFYNSVYKNLYNDSNYLETHSHLKSKISSVLGQNDVLATKQLEYYPLSMDFFKIANEKKINPEILINYIGVSTELWTAWVDSYNAGNIKTPVTLNKDIIKKMSVFVLKDRVSNYIADNQIDIATVNKDEIINNVINEEKKYKTGNIQNTKPESKVKKIKP